MTSAAILRWGIAVFVYRFLRMARLEEKSFADGRAALEAACTDLLLERAAPLDITSEGEIVYDGYEIYGLCEECRYTDEGVAGRSRGR